MLCVVLGPQLNRKHNIIIILNKNVVGCVTSTREPFVSIEDAMIIYGLSALILPLSTAINVQYKQLSTESTVIITI